MLSFAESDIALGQREKLMAMVRELNKMTKVCRGRLRKRKIKHAKEIRSFSTSFVVPSTTDTKRETEKRWLFGLSEGCSAGCPAIQPIADQSDPRS